MQRTLYDPFETSLNAIQSRSVEGHAMDSIRFEHPSPCLPRNPMIIGTQVATVPDGHGDRSFRMASMVDTDSSLRGLTDSRRASESAAPGDVEVLPKAAADEKTVPAPACDHWSAPSLDMRRYLA